MVRSSTTTLLSLALGATAALACGDEHQFQRIRLERRAAAASASSAAASATHLATSSAARAAGAASASGAAAGAASESAAAATVATPTRTDEASAAQITDPAQECIAYSYPPVAALIADGAFPEIWDIADLSTAKSDVTDLFNSLNSSIPSIAPKGTPEGDFSSVNYDGNTDADCWWTWKQCVTPKLEGLPADVAHCPEPSTWGFTLDDGPNCSHNAYYDYLEEQKQKATLFYIGSNVVDWPLEAQRGLADGHEICSHTWSHRYMTSLTNEQAFAELYYSKKAIKDVLGITVQCWRPPYGDVDDRIRYIANALGMSTIIWSDNTFDYEIATLSKSTVEKNYDDILAKAANGTFATQGTIVLTHELNADTMELGEEYLPKIKSAFKYVVPVGVCQNNTNPYVEEGYTYPNFEQWASGTTSISLAAPTAVSTDASMSLPLSTGASGSISATVGFASAAASTGASSGSGGDNAAAGGKGLWEAMGAVVVGAVGAGAAAVLI
ncbi:hypothetical protein JCM6882_007782 [Rhodosporidiobolus microsporus]